MTKMLTSHATVYAREAYGVTPFEWAGKCAALERIIQKEVAHELLNDGCHGIASGRVWTSVIFTP